jgi:hypothetical protein
MAEKLKLWEILKTARTGEKFRIADTGTDLDGSTVVVGFKQNTQGRYLKFEHNNQTVYLSSVIMNADFEKVVDYIPVWEAVKAYYEGQDIASYSEDGIRNAVYSKDGCMFESIHLVEIENYNWTIVDKEECR